MVRRLALTTFAALLASACAETPTASEEAVPTMNVSVTGYCLGGKTASGLTARTGIAAADPHVLPIGSVVRLRATSGATTHDGVYTILDTGGEIRGRRIDIHIPSCAEARLFGRRPMVADVLRKGWAPGSTDNIRRDPTDDRRHQTGAHRAAGSDSRDAADAPSSARR